MTISNASPSSQTAQDPVLAARKENEKARLALEHACELLARAHQLRAQGEERLKQAFQNLKGDLRGDIPDPL
jgi:exonuclease VII small subunit